MATRILSGHYDVAYPPATQFLMDLSRPKTLLRWVRKLRCNWLIVTAGHGFPPEDEKMQEEWLAEVVEEAHGRGVAVLPYISLTNIYRDRFERLHPECKEWYAQDLEGKEVPYAAGKHIPGRRPPRLITCLLSEGWWHYLAAKMDRVADTGVDGLYYDNIFSTCFCPRCQEAYADFTEQRIGERLTFQQMHTFDRRSCMSGGIGVIAKQELATDIALLEEQFHFGQIVGMLARLRERFCERTGESVMVCNAHNRPLLNDVTDIILIQPGQAGIRVPAVGRGEQGGISATHRRAPTGAVNVTSTAGGDAGPLRAGCHVAPAAGAAHGAGCPPLGGLLAHEEKPRFSDVSDPARWPGSITEAHELLELHEGRCGRWIATADITRILGTTQQKESSRYHDEETA